MMKGLGMKYRRGLAFLMAVLMVLVNVLADAGTAYADELQPNENVVCYELDADELRAAIDSLKKAVEAEEESKPEPFTYDGSKIHDGGGCESLLGGDSIYELTGLKMLITGNGDNTSLRVFYNVANDQAIALFINENPDERVFSIKYAGDPYLFVENIHVAGTSMHSAETPVATPSGGDRADSIIDSDIDVASGANGNPSEKPGDADGLPVGGAVVLEVPEESSNTSGNLGDFLTEMTIYEIKEDGSKEQIQGMMSYAGKYEVTLQFNELEDQAKIMSPATADELRDAGILGDDCVDGEWMYIKLVDIKADMVEGSVNNNNDVKIVNDGSVILFRYKKTDDGKPMDEAHITFRGTLNETANLRNVVIVAGSATGTYTPPAADKISVRKSVAEYDAENNLITYNVVVSNPTDQVINSLTVKDTISKPQNANFVNGSFEIKPQGAVESVDITTNEDGNPELTLHATGVNLQPGAEVVLSYKVNVRSSVIGSVGKQGAFDVENNASVWPEGMDPDEDDPVSDDVSYRVDLGYLKKEGGLCGDSGHGNCIEWEIRLYDPYLPLDGTVVTDMIPKGLELYKVTFYYKADENTSSVSLPSYHYINGGWREPNAEDVLHYDAVTGKLTMTIPEGISKKGHESDDGINHIVKITIHTNYELGVSDSYNNTVEAVLPSEAGVKREASYGVPIGKLGVDTSKTGQLAEDGEKLNYTITVDVSAHLNEHIVDSYYGAGAAILDRLEAGENGSRVNTYKGITIRSFTATWTDDDGVEITDVISEEDYGIFSVYPYPNGASNGETYDDDPDGHLLVFDDPSKEMYGWTAIVINPKFGSFNDVRTVYGEWPEKWNGHEVTLKLDYTIDPATSYLKGEHAPSYGNFGWTGSGIETYKNGVSLKEYVEKNGDVELENKAYGIVDGHGHYDREYMNLVEPLKKDGEVRIDPVTSQRRAVYSVTFHNGTYNDGAIPKGATGIVFNDQFDSRMKYVPGTLKVLRTYSDGGGEKVFTYTADPIVDGNKIVAPWQYFVAIGDDDETLEHDFGQQSVKYTYCFTYELETGENFSAKNGDGFTSKIEVNNSAWMSWLGGELDPVEEVLEFPTGVLTKTAAVENGKVVFYVEINENEEDLSPATNTIEVVDTASEVNGLQFSEGNVTVEQFVEGNWSELNDFETESGENGALILTLPDNTHLRIRYEYQLVSDFSGEASITNSVIINGEEAIADGDSWVFKTSDIKSGYDGKNTSFTLKKVDAKTDVALDGAEFILYVRNTATDEGTEEVRNAEKRAAEINTRIVKNGMVSLFPVRVFTTDSNGQVAIKWDYLRIGNTYALVESTAPEGYQRLEKPILFKVDETEQVVIVDGTAVKGGIGEMTVSNTPIEPVGSLKLTKAVKEAPESAADKEYTFTVTGPNSYYHAVTLKAGQSETLTGLTPGDYSVVENSDGTAIENYTLTVDGVGVKNVASNATTEVTVTNTYTRDTGSLTVSKTVVGGGTEAENKTYTFTIVGPADANGTYGGVEFTNGSATVEVKARESKTIEGLPTGEYNVTESLEGTAITGYTLTVSGEGTATVTKDETTGIVITNTYTRDKGSLTVKKTVIGGGTEAADKTYTFTIEGPADVDGTYGGVEFTNGNATVEVNGGGSKTIGDLPTGEYKVTESQDGADITGYTLAVTGENTVTVEKDREARIEVTNTYTRDTGSLTISKTVVGGGTEADNKTYTFTIEGPADANGTYGGVGFTNGSATVEVKARESKTIEGLPTGEYNVTESRDGADITGYTLAVTGENTVTVEKGGEVSIEVTNTYTHDTGNLTVSKTVVGGGTEADNKTYTFTIEGPADANGTYGGVGFTNGSATVEVNAGDSRTLENLPTGTYRVTEESDGTAIENYTLTVSGEGDAVVTKDTTTEVTVTNTYTRDTGRLTVTKTVAGNAPENVANGKTYTFTIEGPADANGTYGDVEFTNGNATVEVNGGGSKTIEGLPTGTYTVTEDGEKAQIIGYTLESNGSVTVTVEANTEAEAEITNTYTQIVISKTVTKTWVDNNNQYGGRPDSISVQLYADGVAVGEPAILNEANSWTYTWSELPQYANGEEIKYTVVEDAVTDYSPSYGSNDNEFTITNTYVPGQTHRTVIKRWEDANDRDGLRPASISVQLMANGEAYGEAVTLNTANNWTYTWEELPEKLAGETVDYTVTETVDVPGYESSIAEDETALVFTITNTHVPVPTGGLSVTKTISGGAAEADRAFRFTVTLTQASGEPISGRFGNMVFTNNQAVVELKGGETAVAEGLPAGTGYSVVEDSYPEYTVTYTNETGTIVAGETAEVVVNNDRPTQPTEPTEPGNTPENPPENPPQNPPENPTEIPENPTPLGGTPPIENISDEPTPLSSFQRLENIEDDDVPLAFMAPVTGDETPAGMAALFGLFALGMMGVFGILASRKEDEEA